MEIVSSTQSMSTIYQQLAQKRQELANIDKKDIEKSAESSYDNIKESNTKYDEKDYQRVVDKFENLDAKTKMHEQMHASQTQTSAPISYSYQMGPDGKLYANGGSVRMDTSIPEDKGEAAVKLEKIENASTAPDALSSADAQIARTANLNKMLLQSQIMNQGDSYES